jgi:hypothetical protein
VNLDFSKDSSIPATTAEVARPRKWWTRGKSVSAVIVGVIGIGYTEYQPIERMGFIGGKPLEVFNLSRYSGVVYDPRTGQSVHGQRLNVGYWATDNDRERQLNLARGMVPYFIRVAEEQRLSSLMLLPSRPLFVRRFPIVIFSTNIRYDRDSLRGLWVEDYRKGDAAKVISGSPISSDDSLARRFLAAICRNDSSGYELIAPSARKDFGKWNEVRELGKTMPENCEAPVSLITIARTDDSSEGRRLGYVMQSGSDSSLVAIWIANESNHRLVNTLQASKVH